MKSVSAKLANAEAIPFMIPMSVAAVIPLASGTFATATRVSQVTPSPKRTTSVASLPSATIVPALPATSAAAFVN